MTLQHAEPARASLSAAPGPGETRKPRPIGWWLVVAAGYVLHVGWRLWLARGATVPVAHVDEDGYLLIARAFAGGPGGYTNENGPFLRVGYPMLLSPIYLFGGDAFDCYQRALVLQAIIGAAVAPLAVLFARRVVRLDRGWAVAAGLAVATLPATTYYARLVLTDAVLPVVGLGWLLLLHAWLTAAPGRARWWYAAGAGAVAGLCSTIHVRGTMVLIAHGLVVIAVLVARRGGRGPAAVTVLAAAAGAGLNQVGLWYLGDAIVVLGDSPHSQVSTLLDADWRVALLIVRVVGQFWYVAIGTLGFGLLGLWVAVRPLLNGPDRRRLLAGPAEAGRWLTLLAALIASALIAAGSAASLPFGEHRITYFAYPRYLHFLFPVWFLVGLGALLAVRGRARLRLTAVTVAATVGLAAVVQWRTAQEPGYWFIPFDVPELLALSGQWFQFTVVLPTVIALGLFVALAAASHGRRAAISVLPAVALLGLVATPLARANILDPMAAIQYRPDTPLLERDLGLGPADVVAEAYQVPFPFAFNHAREISWQRVLLFDAALPPPSEATVVIAPWSAPGSGYTWDGRSWHLRLVGVDTFHGWAVWRRSG